jgi:hypothetical protein
MTTPSHLTMEQLLAVRDGDRSEPAYAEAHDHVAACSGCRLELDRLHQRTARIRALPQLRPARNQFPAVRTRFTAERRQRRLRSVGIGGLAIAASLVLTVIGRDLVRPARLDAEQAIATAKSESQQLEQQLHDWDPKSRVLNSRAAVMVMELEDRIADLDARLAETRELDRQLALWQRRVDLMNTLVEVHVTRASNVGF